MSILFSKVSKYLIFGLAIILVIIAVTLIINTVYPKYDFYVTDDDTVYKLNKITGKVTRHFIPMDAIEEAQRFIYK